MNAPTYPIKAIGALTPKQEKPYKVMGIFAYPIIKFCMPRMFTDSEMSFIKSTKQISRGANGTNTFSENTYILNSLELSSIKQFILDSLNTCFKEIYDPKFDIKLNITQSWLNFSSLGQYHVPHMHSNSFPFSGVLYIDANRGVDLISFEKNLTTIQLRIENNKRNEYTAEKCEIPVQTGDLIIFPSNLMHSVPPISGDNDRIRISLSFNTFPSGIFCNEHSLAQLQLP